MKKLLILLLLTACPAANAFAQMAKVDSLNEALKFSLAVLDPKGLDTKKIFKAIDAMKYIASPKTVKTDMKSIQMPNTANPQIATKEKELQGIKDEITKVTKDIETAKQDQQKLLEDSVKAYNTLLEREQLILSIVNEKFSTKYDPREMEDAKNLLTYVEFHPLKANVAELVDKYEVWLDDINRILSEAAADFNAKPRPWDGILGGTSRGEVFIGRLSSCAYNNRRDKSWSIAYLDEYIKAAKARITMYKDRDKRKGPLDFSDIADKAAEALQ